MTVFDFLHFTVLKLAWPLTPLVQDFRHMAGRMCSFYIHILRLLHRQAAYSSMASADSFSMSLPRLDTGQAERAMAARHIERLARVLEMRRLYHEFRAQAGSAFTGWSQYFVSDFRLSAERYTFYLSA